MGNKKKDYLYYYCNCIKNKITNIQRKMNSVKDYTYGGPTHDDGQDKTKVELFFGCRKLADMDTITVSDPLIKFYELKGGVWICLGETEQIDNNLNPNFAKSFVVDFIFETKQLFKCEVNDF